VKIRLPQSNWPTTRACRENGVSRVELASIPTHGRETNDQGRGIQRQFASSAATFTRPRPLDTTVYTPGFAADNLDGDDRRRDTFVDEDRAVLVPPSPAPG
jgi:hypothetical protein